MESIGSLQPQSGCYQYAEFPLGTQTTAEVLPAGVIPMASPLMRVYVIMSTVPRGWHDPQENFDAMAADGGSLEHSQLHHIFLRYTSS